MIKPVIKLIIRDTLLQFQINMLRDRASYYQALVTRQKKLLSTVRTELSELREMKKSVISLLLNSDLIATTGNSKPLLERMQL